MQNSVVILLLVNEITIEYHTRLIYISAGRSVKIPLSLLGKRNKEVNNEKVTHPNTWLPNE